MNYFKYTNRLIEIMFFTTGGLQGFDSTCSACKQFDHISELSGNYDHKTKINPRGKG